MKSTSFIRGVFRFSPTVKKAIIGVVIFFIFLAIGRTTLHSFPRDNSWIVPTATSFVKEFNLEISEMRVEYPEFTGIYKEIGGKFYYFFPYGTSLLISPFVLALHVVGIDTTHKAAELDKWFAVFFIALSCVAVCMTYYRKKRVLPAIVILLLYFFGTSVISVGTESLWQHTTLLPIYAYVFLVLYRKLYVKNFYLLSSFGLLYFAWLVRPLAAIPIAAFSLYLLIRDWKGFLKTVPIGFTILLLSGLYHLNVYGSFLHSYYRLKRLSSGTFWEALAGNVISPGRGLLVYSPFLILSIFGFICLVRRKNILLPIIVAITIVLHWIVISTFPHWWAGYTYGPRFFTEMMPLFMYFIYELITYLSSHWKKKAAIVLMALFVLLSGASVFIHLKGAYDPNTQKWNTTPNSIDEHPERLWDYSDPAFLRSDE